MRGQDCRGQAERAELSRLPINTGTAAGGRWMQRNADEGQQSVFDRRAMRRGGGCAVTFVSVSMRRLVLRVSLSGMDAASVQRWRAGVTEARWSEHLLHNSLRATPPCVPLLLACDTPITTPALQVLSAGGCLCLSITVRAPARASSSEALKSQSFGTLRYLGLISRAHPQTAEHSRNNNNQPYNPRWRRGCQQTPVLLLILYPDSSSLRAVPS